MRVHIYARVSTDAQAEKGYSLPTQLEACRKKAEEIGATEIHEYKDDYTGAELDRPDFSRLREAIDKKKVDAIVAYDPDRLFRKQAHQGLFLDDMVKAGVKVVFVSVEFNDNAEGRLMLGVRGAVSEYERAKIRERTIRGKKGKARDGKIVMNTKPTGYDFDPLLSMYVPNKDADLVRKLFGLAAKGKSITAIIRQLNQEKIPSPKGKLWHAATVSRILHNTMYYGEAIQFREKREKIDGKWVTTERDPNEWVTVSCPALVSREEFEVVQSSIAENQRFSRRNTQQTYLIQHIARCGICGRNMMISRRGRKAYYYLCSSHRKYSDTGERHCGSRGIRTDLLDEMIWGKLKSLAANPKLVRHLIGEKKVLTKTTKTLDKLLKFESELLDRQKYILNRIARSGANIQADEALDFIDKELKDAKKQIEALQRSVNIKNTDDRVNSFVTAINNIENRQEACRQALEAVFVTRTDNNMGRYADTEVDVKIRPK